MELQSPRFHPKTGTSRMRKQVLGLLALAVLCFAFTGCSTVQNYSIRSYQGPLPMEDYPYINPEAYGLPTVAR